MPSDVMISLRKLSRFWGQTPAVQDLDLEINIGEIVCLVGPSGCGKTTTLKMINRLIEPSSGEIYVDGREIRSLPAHELRRGIGYVIQQTGLFPHQTIESNIATVPNLLGWDKGRVASRVGELMSLVGLEPALLSRYPSQLSGGQQQRVGVARALAADPPVLLMDEPFGAVDPIVRQHLQAELLDLQATLHKTIVFVTHDVDEAIHLGDKVAILNVGGNLEQYGRPEELLSRPANAFVEQFLGAERGLKRLSLIKVSDMDLSGGCAVAADAPVGDAIATMESHGQSWVGVVADGRLTGWATRDSLSQVERAGQAPVTPFVAWARSDSTLREALDVLVMSRTNVCVVFDASDRYLGMLNIDQISGEVREADTAR